LQTDLTRDYVSQKHRADRGLIGWRNPQLFLIL
jgi:hypothetical protein